MTVVRPSHAVQASDLAWQEAPMKGLLYKDLWSDGAQDRVARLVRFLPGTSLPRCRHKGDELVYVVEGAISDEYGTLAAGDAAFWDDGCTHTVSSKNGAVVFAVMTGGVEAAEDAQGAPEPVLVRLSELPWEDVMPGVRAKTIWSDEASRRTIKFARFEPTAEPPRHRHIGDELVFGIEGALQDDWCEISTGNFSYRPAGCAHTIRSKNGATLLTYVVGGIEPA